MHPSRDLYQSLQTAFDLFNQELFDGALPSVIFTVQRQKEVLGYFAPDRWVSPKGERCHEIAINPTHMGQSRVIEVLQTLAHEMVHCWQYCFGNPGRQCYHNKEWANKMLGIGLHPSSTGLPGGKITGQHMSDYPVEGGPFLKVCHTLVEQHAFRIPWIYRLSLPLGIDFEAQAHSDDEAVQENFASANEEAVAVVPLEVPSPPSNNAPDTFLYSTYRDVLPEGSFYTPPTRSKSKIKYQCPSCFNSVWGKPGMHVICGNCRIDFEEFG